MPEQAPERVAVLGAGSWGTVVAKVLADSGHSVTMWARRAEVANEIDTRNRNSSYLPQLRLPASLRATADVSQALSGAGVVVLAVPSQQLRENLLQWRDVIPTTAAVLNLAKGIERDTLARMSEVIADAAGVSTQRIAVLSGPNLAAEIAEEQPAAAVLAAHQPQRAEQLQRLLTARYLRVYTNTDVVGCELGGACKNVIALACGLAAGMGFGSNTTAALMTRGLAEIGRLGAAMGAQPLTMSGLAGLGDLVATCSSPLSRNRTFGQRLGSGETLQQAQRASKGQVAEGAKSCSAIRELGGRHGVEMPITEVVHRVCHEELRPQQAVAELLERSQKSE